MENAVNSLIDLLDSQRDKEQNNIAGYDVKVPVIYRNVEELIVSTWKSDNRLYNVSQVSRSYWESYVSPRKAMRNQYSSKIVLTGK